MNPPDQLLPLMKLGLFKSVEILSSFVKTPSTRTLITRAKALAELKKYNDALAVLDSISATQRTEEEMNDIIELRFTCYFANPQTSATRCSQLLPLLLNRTLTPKLHIMAAEAHILQDSTHSQNHPAIPHLMEVLKLYPTAIELAMKMLSLGASIEPILSHMPASAAKTFMQALQQSSHSEFEAAIQSLSGLSKMFNPLPTCVLNRICINAVHVGDMELFDSTARLIPMTDLEIIDLRAARLKKLKRADDLNELALTALNTNEESANAWLAFSHLLELNNDSARALQTTRKALLLDRNSRRGFMRHGELRMQKHEVKKALTAFTKAHQLHEGIDSYTAIVQCHVSLGDWMQAESYATRAAIAYPFEGEHGAFSMGLMGLALRNRDENKAIGLLRKALEKNSDNIDALTALIDIKCRDSDLDGAEAILREYREKQSDFFFWLKLGEIYALKRDLLRALEFVTKAVQLDGTDTHAREMLEQLEQVIRDHDSDFDAEEDQEDLL